MRTSIIIPSTGRSEQLMRCLLTLKPTTKGHDVEVIVVIDADKESLRAVGEWSVSPEDWSQFRVVIDYSDTLRGISAAFNAGLAKATGDVIGIGADDLEYTEGWLDEALKALATITNGGMVGLNDTHHNGNTLSTHYLFDRRFIVDILGGRIAWECYKHSFNDLEITERGRRSGRFKWAEKAVVKHNHWNFGTRPQDATDGLWLDKYPESQMAYDARLAAGFPNDYPPIIGAKSDKVRVGWLVDPISYEGGAELVAKELAALCPDDMVIVPCSIADVSADVDIYVLHNCVHYKPDVIKLLEQKPVVKVVHDVWPHGDPTLRAWLLEKASLIILSSQLHKDSIPYDITAPVKFIPPYVDAEKYAEAAAITKRKGTCSIGRWWNGKGLGNLAQYARANNITIDVYGFGPEVGTIQPPLMFKGAIEQDEVANVLARYERFVFLPDAVEPFSRTTAEAWLAGCEVVVNRNVGALEYIEGDSTPLFKPAFWDAVRGVLPKPQMALMVIPQVEVA